MKNYLTALQYCFENGDFIVIDAAAKYGGYHADMTRTPVVGEATGKHKEVYSVV